MGCKSLCAMVFLCVLAAGAAAESTERFTGAAAGTWQLQNWRESRGNSPVLTQLYQSYSNQALYVMAGDDDIYALQAAHDRLRDEGQLAPAYDGLIRAAALGSSAALIMAGAALEDDISLWRLGALEIDRLREAYQLPAESDSLQLALKAAAHYLAAALMGDVDRADIQMEQMLMGYPRDFIDQHWPLIAQQAEVLLQDIALYRKQVLALPEFELRYPDAYARFYSLPLGRVSEQYLFERWR